MTVPRTAGDVLSEHVVFEIESIDRLLLQLYQPKLQYGGGVVNFFKWRGWTYASSATMRPMTRAFVANVEHYAATCGLDLLDFRKQADEKDVIAGRYLAAAAAAAGCRPEQVSEQVLFIGTDQETASVWHTQARTNPDTGASYAWLVRAKKMPKHFYFYLVDDDFGPMFIKVCTYFPFNIKVCLNGNEYAKRQAVKAGIEFEPMDNAFAAAADPAAIQQICAELTQLSPEKINQVVFKWLKRLPYPFTADDDAAGYEYDISVLQAEFSLTQMLDRPLTGRIFFDQLVTENLDIGRPDKVSLVFDRKMYPYRRTNPTPGRFRTRVVHRGVIPSLHLDYKRNKLKQYHKHGRALRTETTINNPRDFGIGKRLTNLPHLAQIGFDANRRLLDVQTISHDPADGHAALTALTTPVITESGTRIPALRVLDERVQALLKTLCVFGLLFTAGFTNRDLRTRLAGLLGLDVETITSGHITHRLRQLKARGLIERIPGTFRYTVTTTGYRHALFLTRVHDRIWRTGLAQLTDPDPPADTALRQADRAYWQALDNLLGHANIAT